MTHQAALIPSRHGPDIWRRFRLPGTNHINAAPWEDARARGHPVGTCRAPAGDKTCGGYLDPGPPYTVGTRRMYPATCATCGHETAAAGPAPARKRKTAR